jgi:TetR/AcrR family transcriptional regulator, regulator of autoinduction and epiphytic fitness
MRAITVRAGKMATMTASEPTAKPTPDTRVTADQPTDGRAARAARTRAAIVDALLMLLEEGDLQPTANRIAERAGISLRLIYHHFGDLEALFHAAAIRQGERLIQLTTPIPLDLPFDERLDLFVLQRSDLLEWMTPVRRASLLQEPFSEELRRARDTLIAVGEQYAAALFAEELALVARERRSAVRASLAAASGWNFWDSLRTSGRSIDDTRAAVRCTLEALLRP